MKRSAPEREKISNQLVRLNLTEGQLRAIQGLEKGRHLAIELAKISAAKNARLVMDAALKDLDAGEPARGRAKRIALGLPPDSSGRSLTERSVKRILDKLSVCPIASAQNGQKREGVHAK